MRLGPEIPGRTRDCNTNCNMRKAAPAPVRKTGRVSSGIEAAGIQGHRRLNGVQA